MYYTVLFFDIAVILYLVDYQNVGHINNLDLSLTGLLQEKHIPIFAAEKNQLISYLL